MDDKDFRSAPSAQGTERERRHDEISAILIYTTFPSESEAKSVGRALVERGLAACVNIFPQMIAIFSWQGEVEEAGEAAMIVKTVQARADDVLAEIKRLHPYAVPARLILPVAGGGEDYLKWIAEQCGRPANCDTGAE
jgi:periplasmic divalent cation tolerance protein